MVPAFLRENARWLGAGGLLMFASSFGQTWFISLYAGEIRADYGLSHGAWGGIYAAGTLVSAGMMLAFGGLVDRFRIRAVAIGVMVAFAATTLVLAGSTALWLLPVIIFGLRFCGQGLMTHLSQVGTARWFAARRGRALAIAATGLGAGEAILPVTFVTLMGILGWRGSWAVAALLLLAMIPVLAFLLSRERRPEGRADAGQTAGLAGRHWTRGQAVSHWLFWALFPGLLAQPVFGTAFFFQQVHLVEIKGWTLAAFAALIPLYTAATFAGLFAGGLLIDRVGAARLMPVYLLPMCAGFLIVALAPAIPVAAVGMVCLGLTQGVSSVALGALWPELYGTRHLGAIRSVATSLMVFATAIGPAVTGVLIDAGVSYAGQLAGMSAYILAVSALNLAALARLRLSAVA